MATVLQTDFRFVTRLNALRVKIGSDGERQFEFDRFAFDVRDRHRRSGRIGRGRIDRLRKLCFETRIRLVQRIGAVVAGRSNRQTLPSPIDLRLNVRKSLHLRTPVRAVVRHNRSKPMLKIHVAVIRGGRSAARFVSTIVPASLQFMSCPVSWPKV